jgi:hypothetical protein
VDGARQTPRASLTRSGFVEGEIVAASDGARDSGNRCRITLLAGPILQGADRQRERVIAKHLRKPSREISPPRVFLDHLGRHDIQCIDERLQRRGARTLRLTPAGGGARTTEYPFFRQVQHCAIFGHDGVEKGQTTGNPPEIRQPAARYEDDDDAARTRVGNRASDTPDP